MLAEQGAVPADRVEGIRLAGLVAGGPVQLQGALRVVEGLAVMALPFKCGGVIVVGGALAGLVTEPLVQLKGATGVGVGVGVAAEQRPVEGESTVCSGLLGQVAKALSC